MAPYTMNVVIVNETEATVHWIGASTLTSLDGETTVAPLSVAPHAHGNTTISKGGGTDGLFTALTWGVGSAEPRFLVWTRMPASNDGVATARLRDVFGMGTGTFVDSAAADYCEANNTNSKVLVDSFAYGGLKVRAAADAA
jgi:hypothetical protein